MNIRDWLVGILRDPIWEGIAGVIAVLGLLFALFRLVMNLIRGIKTQQSLIEAFNKTIVEITGWLRRLIDYVFTRSWKVQIPISIIIYVIFSSQKGITPELTNLLALLTAVCWLLVRTAYTFHKEIKFA
ncbi:MAG: hypothetical protein E3J21_01445 [Anaerolineales bacterium]|nr:MAG: hypothetical protein E3J21_01445 [Anaerolineales bacterium]